MEFSEKLRSLRKEKGLSQEKLAERLTVTRQSVSKWESGQAFPEIEKLIKISDLFGVSLDELIKDRKTRADPIEIEEIEEDDEEMDEYLIVGGFIIGIGIGLLTGNFLLGSVGGFIGLGLPYVIKGVKGRSKT
ncbi:helix-turn-helix domain-containing protein [Lacticigenium naphthae]|uniref:helix-turn-helix domain-containing protein n=1 Tax=Lacticigenium naphthae TaxID=515351 RepID=UPI000429D687|nr:helix-turn-helix transcriptional regulator [Lacticigenium naphthae]